MNFQEMTNRSFGVCELKHSLLKVSALWCLKGRWNLSATSPRLVTTASARCLLDPLRPPHSLLISISFQICRKEYLRIFEEYFSFSRKLQGGYKQRAKCTVFWRSIELFSEHSCCDVAPVECLHGVLHHKRPENRSHTGPLTLKQTVSLCSVIPLPLELKPSSHFQPRLAHWSGSRFRRQGWCCWRACTVLNG